MPAENPNPRTPDDDSLFQGGNWFSRRMEALITNLTPKCTEMTHLLSEEMDHPLPWLTRVRMRVHFLMCCYCRRYKENLHYLRKVLRSRSGFVDDSPGEALPPEAKERLKQALRDESNSS
jgi:hypothetical protein